MKKVCIEWYGCAVSRAEAEKQRQAFKEAGWTLKENLEEADYFIINTCAVKAPTEEKIISRLEKIQQNKKTGRVKIVVAGCLGEVNSERIKKIAPNALITGTDPKKISKKFGINLSYSPTANAFKYNECISVIPVAIGCLNKCAYCCVSIARGKLKSYSEKEINAAFKKAIRHSKEIWLTATDVSCYGFEKNTNMAKLLEKLLENKGSYRIRIGMLNPQHAKKFFPELLRAMEDERVYKFFHLPVQSGSDSTLKKMMRGHSVRDFENLVAKTRKKFPDATIATDIIAGFPGETKKDFKDTLKLMETVKADITNVSRYGNRPGAKAALIKQLPSRIVKERSIEISVLARKSAFENNQRHIGKKMEILLSEKKGDLLIGRNKSYKPVIIRKGIFGNFAVAEIKAAKTTHLEGIIDH